MEGRESKKEKVLLLSMSEAAGLTPPAEPVLFPPLVFTVSAR